uniref:Uncharacterized protein n=1 Tax=Tetranychus urticae TaxID=32264 RepID=T1KGL3_TETUR
MNNSNEVDISKFIKFCIACTSQLGSQCILTRKPFLWIVFSYKSDAQKVLPKVQIMYPDAIISEPPIDLTLTTHESPYTVESCEQVVPNEASSDSGADNSNIAIVKPERAMQINLQDQSSSIASVAGIRLSDDNEPKASMELVTTSIEPQNIFNLDVCVDKDSKIFFRCDSSFVTLMLYYQPTKWTLLYNLFEKLYDLGAKKVIFDGNLYCAHFDSVSAYQEAFTEKRSRYLEHLEVVNVSKTHRHEVTKKMDRYITGTPWCLNQELDLCCLVVKIESKLHNEFIEMCKNILGNRECIFIKSVPGEIWIGFPDELICKNSKKTVIRLLADLPQTNVSMAKPSNELLESINFPDLVGDAYDLAFLSSQLESSKPITRPRIIQQMSLKQMQGQKFNEALFHITVKIFVKFSKVIPLAATASYFAVNLIYNSWYEAHASRHFLDKLTLAEVPYFKELHKASEVKRQQVTCYDFLEYYIINDQRKVLEKIVQNKNPVEKLDSNSSTVQSPADIDVLDREMIKKLQYLFTISTNSGFKFTSEMISIIKMNLVQMECPACIEFQDKIWVGVDDLEKGNKVKARFRYLNFKMLHEKDENDFDVGIVMQLVPSIPTKIAKMLANKLIKTTEAPVANVPLLTQAVPLGHFNYNYRKAVGMSISRYCQSYESVRY